MARELAVVPNEEPTPPGAVTAEMIAAALERFKAANETPLEHYDRHLGGVFRFKKLTGAEVRECGKLAIVDAGKPTQHLDQQQLEFLIVNRASTEPRVTTVLWAQLLQIDPMVTAALGAAVLRANGLGADDPVEEAGKD
jgi:hypothetical protein